MNASLRKMEKNDDLAVLPRTMDEEFENAVERVYRHYGSDLDAFVRDVQGEMLKQLSKNGDSHVVTPYCEDCDD